MGKGVHVGTGVAVAVGVAVGVEVTVDVAVKVGTSVAVIRIGVGGIWAPARKPGRHALGRKSSSAPSSKMIDRILMSVVFTNSRVESKAEDGIEVEQKP